MKKLSDYTDSLGLIGQRKANGFIEGGDSLQRTGMLAIADYFNYGISPAKAAFVSRMRHHEIKPGILVRHPDPSQWYSRSDTTSRDQTTPIIVACGLLDCRDLLDRITIQQIKRFGFYQNWRESNEKFKLADYASLEHVGFYIRAFRAKWLYPLLYISDLFSLVQSTIKAFIYSRNPINCDDNNRCISLVQSNVVMPTFLSRASLKIYKKRKSFVAGKKGPRYAIERYFSGIEDCPIDVEWNKILTLFFD
jgi:hypothetical protein